VGTCKEKEKRHVAETFASWLHCERAWLTSNKNKNPIEHNELIAIADLQ
jgi:hypothetical protein